jgi:hypothetical protein
MVSLAELLREGLPSAIFSAIAHPRTLNKRDIVRNLSSDWLAYIFGVTPLVRDVDKMLKMVVSMNDVIYQLVRDSGNVVRRSRVMVDTTSLIRSNSSNNSGGPSILLSNGGEHGGSIYGNPSITSYQTLIKKVWFAGAFQYWIPGLRDPGTDFQSVNPTDALSAIDIGLHISGLRATPKAAWNLLPFSWLVDWFVNVSDLFESADAMTQYGLVMPYGYVMGENKLITTTTYDFRNFAHLKHLGSVSSSIVATRQQRKRATPYGFGLKDVDLNPIQWSILAALGLSSGRR